MFKARKQRFKLDLQGLHATCEANYVRLMRLFPDYETSNRREFEVEGARVELEVIERSRYTTFFRISQQRGASEWLGTLRIEVRAYHDAGMLEVGCFQSRQQIRPRYQYPNPQMYQQDEKIQQNSFLADWLEHCLLQGSVLDAPYQRAAGR